MNKKAFTLVELIVVITILAVLATVAFISFQGHAITARDSARISDIKSMTKIIELYNVRNGKYPYPDSKTNITYSGAIAWTQGVFGTSAYTNGSSMSNVPVDPVTGLEYPYSTTSSRQEYQIAAVLEDITTSKLTSTTYAGTQEAQIYVKGNYNGKFLKVRTNTSTYLLGVPSIIASDILSSQLLEEILKNERLVYNGFKNLPASFSGSIYNTSPADGFTFGTGSYVADDLILFVGDTNDLETDPAKRVDFLDKLQASYSGSVIKDESDISELLAVDSNSTSAASNYVAVALNNTLKTSILVITTTVLTDWRSQDPNCVIPDITKGLQTWAGCNSTLGTGVEYIENNVNSCVDYLGDNDATGCDRQSNEKENIWNPTYGIGNIWGKLYTWDQAMGNIGDGACQNGYHVPSDAELTILETELGSATGVGLGWKSHSLKTINTNLVEFLKLPLSGNWHANHITFYYRGYTSALWTSTETGISNAYRRWFSWNSENVARYAPSKGLGYSVRCIKD